MKFSVLLCLIPFSLSGQLFYEDAATIWHPFIEYISSAETGYNQTQIMERVAPMTRESPYIKNDVRRKLGAHIVLGKLYRERGLYENAYDHLNHGMTIIDKAPDKSEFAITFKSDGANDLSSFTFFDVFDEMGLLYLDLGKTKQATEYFNKSLEMRRAYLKKRHGLISRPYLGLGKVARLKNELDKSQESYQQAIKILLSSSATSISPRLLYAELYADLAKVLFEKGENKKAIRNAKQALNFTTLLSYEALTTYKTGDFLQKSKIENLISEIYLAENDLENAQKWLEKADQTYREHFSIQLNHYSEILKTYAKLQWKKEDFETAQKFLEYMMDNHINHITRNFSSLNQKEKEDFYDKIVTDLDLYFDRSIQYYNQTKDQAILQAILNRRISTKGFLLNDEQKIRSMVLNSSDESVKAEYEKLQELRELYAHEVYSNPKGGKLNQIQSEIEQLEKSMSEHSSKFGTNNKTTFTELIPALQPDEAAIELIRFTGDDEKVNYGYLKFDNMGLITLRKISLTPEEETKLAKLYVNSMKFGLADYSVFEKMWAPIHADLSNYKTAIVSSDGIFNQININTLAQEGSKYVIDDYQVINVTNLKDIKELSNDAIVNKISRLFGQPNYTTSVAVDVELASSLGLDRSNLSFQFENFQDQTFSDLPGTREEVITISNTLKKYGWEVTTSLGQEATEFNVKASKNPGLLHIATHGFFLDNSSPINPMIKSGLVMAGVNDSGNRLDDGILTAYEAANLSLEKTWLVVLSACETGLGEVKNGEGVYGLQRALGVAGAKNLMMSLWQVDDAATKDFMIHFYQKIVEDKSIREAAFESQKAVRQKYPHPKYWGPFILIQF